MGESNQIIKLISDVFGIPVIEEKKNYWFVRTKGGRYFEEFYFDNFIAINWNKVNNIDLIRSGKEDINKILKDIIIKEYPKEKRPGLAATQIIRFVNEMKKGDIVLMPNKNSQFISFGELIEDDIYIENIKNAIELESLIMGDDEDGDEDQEELEIEEQIEEACPFIKRRRVKWLKTIKRENLDPYLYLLTHSHNTISDANNYADLIDRSLNSFYIKGGKAHVIFEVKQEKDIPAIDIINFIGNSLNIIDVFNDIMKEKLEKYDIDLKINVQSPGPIEFSGDIWKVLVLGLAIMGICGGGLYFESTKEYIKAGIQSEGLLEKVIKFLDHLHKNKLENKQFEFEKEIIEAAQKLKIQMPSLNQNMREFENKEKQ